MFEEVKTTLSNKERTNAALWGVVQIAVGAATIFMGVPNTGKADRIRAKAMSNTNGNSDNLGVAIQNHINADRRAARAEAGSGLLTCAGVVGMMLGVSNLRKAIRGEETSYSVSTEFETTTKDE